MLDIKYIRIKESVAGICDDGTLSLSLWASQQLEQQQQGAEDELEKNNSNKEWFMARDKDVAEAVAAAGGDLKAELKRVSCSWAGKKERR